MTWYANFELDDNPPQYPLQRDIVVVAPKTETPDDYLWLERYIPYNAANEKCVHWFLRFK